jgi:hypothetical protein
MFRAKISVWGPLILMDVLPSSVSVFQENFVIVFIRHPVVLL